MKDWKLHLIYARRELRAGLSGFYVFLLCLILGVGAIAAVQSVSASLDESFRQDGRQILGGDIEVRKLYEPLTAAEAAYFKPFTTASSLVIKTRAMLRRVDETRTSLAEVKAVDGVYPLYGEIETADGGTLEKNKLQELLAQKDGRWGLVVPKDILDRLEAKEGDTVLIGDIKFDLRGVYKLLPDRVGSMSFMVAPHILMSADALLTSGLLTAGTPATYEHRFSLAQKATPEALKALEKKIEGDFPDAKWRVKNFYNAAPGLERQIERLTFFLTLIGLTTLVVGGVGISSAVRAYLDTKLASIATLKCVGASGAFVFRVYMLQVIALSLLGIGIGGIVGSIGAVVGSRVLAEKLSLTQAPGLYPEALGLAAAFGLLVTLCFSLWPLGRAVNVSPADLFRDTVAPKAKRPSAAVMAGIVWAVLSLAALAVSTAPDRKMAIYFTGGTIAAIAIFLGCALLVQRLLKSAKRPENPEARMAVANLTRPGNVTTGSVMSLGLGLTVLITIALVEYNFSRLLKEDLAADAPSFFFLDIQQDQLAGFSKAALSHPSARNLRITPNLRGRITKVNGRDAETALVDKTYEWVIRSDRGFTYTDALPPHSTITDGAWWPANYKGPPIISVATDVARAFNIGAGAELTVEILGNEITAKIANVREINWASFTMNFAVTFAPGVLEEMPASSIATLIIDENDESALQSQLAKDFPNVSSIRVREALETATEILGAISQAVRVSAGVTLAAGALVLAGGVAAARRRHVYDSIILKVLGASRLRIAKTFLLEYGLLGLMAVIIAAAIGTVAAWAVLTHVMHLPWKFHPLSLIYVGMACLGLTLLAGFFGTWQALSQKPAPWLRNQ